MTKFSEIPWFIIKNYVSDYSSQNMTLYKKNDDINYVKVVGVINSAGDYIEYNRLKLQRLFTLDPSGSGYLYDITNDDDIYVRKDGDFIGWIEDNWSSYKNFLNPEIKYLYLGKGYKDDTYIYVNHYAFKDWMLDALPRNTRNSTLDEFFYTIYDQLYHKVYSMEKNLFTLFDPYEIDSDLLDDIMTMYNEAPLLSDISVYKRRVYTANMIYWLKKKGTYAALFIIWYILTKESGNNLTVYDRWHSLSVSSGSPSGYFEDYDYTNFYDASADYPVSFTTSTTSASSIHSQTVSSTSWSVTHDLSTTDLITQVYNWDLDKIIPKDIQIVDGSNITIDFGTSASGFALITKIDYTEVGNGVINHSLGEQYVISQHYKSNYFMNAYSVEATDANNLTVETSASGADNYILTPEYIHNQSTQSSTWTVNHDLGYIGVVVDVYNRSNERIIPDSISLSNKNKCIVTFSEPIDGWCGITSVSNVNEALDTLKVLSTHYRVDMNLNNNPFGTKLLSENLMKNLYNKWENNRPVTKFSHYNLNLPITTDFSGTEISVFSSPIYDANIYSASTYYSAGDNITEFSGTWVIKFGIGSVVELGTWNYNSSNDIKNEYFSINFYIHNFTEEANGVRFNFSIPKNANNGYEGYITEIGIFNNNNDLTWYSRVDNLYKHKEVTINIDYFAQFVAI